MGQKKPGNLIALSLAAFALAIGIGAGGQALDIPVVVIAVVVFVLIAVMTMVARKRVTGRWSYDVVTWSGDREGKRVEVLFDERQVFINRLSLRVDGAEVDRNTIWWGVKTLSGQGVEVKVGSGWIGQCTGVEFVDGQRLSEQPA